MVCCRRLSCAGSAGSQPRSSRDYLRCFIAAHHSSLDDFLFPHLALFTRGLHRKAIHLGGKLITECIASFRWRGFIVLLPRASSIFSSFSI